MLLIQRRLKEIKELVMMNDDCDVKRSARLEIIWDNTKNIKQTIEQSAIVVLNIAFVYSNLMSLLESTSRRCNKGDKYFLRHQQK